VGGGLARDVEWYRVLSASFREPVAGWAPLSPLAMYIGAERGEAICGHGLRMAVLRRGHENLLLSRV
jgi:hypothetical protein